MTPTRIFGAMGDAADIKRNADNQNHYREVNERVMEANADFDLPAEGGRRIVEVFCECGDASCADRVEITRVTYERVRSDPETFVLTRGHDQGLVEVVIERTPGYVIARNIGTAARIAINGDPRGGAVRERGPAMTGRRDRSQQT